MPTKQRKFVLKSNLTLNVDDILWVNFLAVYTAYSKIFSGLT